MEDGVKHDLIEYKWLVEALECKCVTCKTPLKDLEIELYQHEDGWEVRHLKGKYWLYITCPNCGYQNSFEKLGIPRDKNKIEKLLQDKVYEDLLYIDVDSDAEVF